MFSTWAFRLLYTTCVINIHLGAFFLQWFLFKGGTELGVGILPKDTGTQTGAGRDKTTNLVISRWPVLVDDRGGGLGGKVGCLSWSGMLGLSAAAGPGAVCLTPPQGKNVTSPGSRGGLLLWGRRYLDLGYRGYLGSVSVCTVSSSVCLHVAWVPSIRICMYTCEWGFCVFHKVSFISF